MVINSTNINKTKSSLILTKLHMYLFVYRYGVMVVCLVDGV